MSKNATTSYHDVEPCAIERTGMASARCLTHNVGTAEMWPTFSDAGRRFVCDGGRGLRFIIVSGDDGDGVPVMRDLSGLARTLRGNAEAPAYCGDNERLNVWLWHPGGKLEPLTIAVGEMSDFDGDDYAVQTWTVSGRDGRLILDVSVRIDGRV